MNLVRKRSSEIMNGRGYLQNDFQDAVGERLESKKYEERRSAYVVSESKGNSRLGSGSKVVISHVVVGPVESSALKSIVNSQPTSDMGGTNMSKVRGYPAPAKLILIPVLFSSFPPPK